MSDYKPRARTLSAEVLHARNTTPFALDFEAQRLVAENPGGCTLDAIGEFLELSRERVRQIEAHALRRLREGLAMEQFRAHAALDQGETVERVLRSG